MSEVRNKEGKLHRVDGPAIITDNFAAWYYNGRLHKEDGPAIIGHSGDALWFIHGVKLTEAEFDLYVFVNGGSNERVS